jgi:hypothetical protein
MERIESLSSKLLGRRWGLSHRTLERWRHDGNGPAFLKIGGRVVYRLEDVQAFESTLVRQPVKPGLAPEPSRGPR